MTKPRTKRSSHKNPEPKPQTTGAAYDPVEEASKESFPASDSPASNAGQDAPQPKQEK